MIVYRLSKSQFANDLSGRGAELAGGRWNSKGLAMLYTSASRALCTAEIAVHTPLGIVPTDYVIVEMEVPEDSLNEILIADLPKNWREFPHSQSTKRTGDLFLNNCTSLILKVPSAVVSGDYNYLINPNHLDFHKVRILSKENFEFDRRLFLK
ncbi:RES family NAD+ phosphorylase [Lacihabitans soyangensis]|uniref:RES domain-containing protein n=1 Tax=Lacihabitans soyangensis TaxID=869394 RepID=A0AAE3KSI3_9BACT|nr:RES family NAD+ phosphorylase [Lacihabitans soyangensis]MCP9763387.1 RES domain-containing protein [Lacihabitans soyangensis]